MTAVKRAIRDVYGDTLAQLGSENKNIIALDADVGSSSKSIVFGKAFPERYFNVGIAEANMVAMAAGFATTGKIPFANTFAAFMVLRAGDPVRSLIYAAGDRAIRTVFVDGHKVVDDGKVLTMDYPAAAAALHEAQKRIKDNVPGLDWDHRSADTISPLTFPPG